MAYIENNEAPETMSVTFSFGLVLDLRFAEAESMGVCVSVPPIPIAPGCCKIPEESAVESVLQL